MSDESGQSIPRTPRQIFPPSYNMLLVFGDLIYMDWNDLSESAKSFARYQIQSTIS
jgi:hypothetical protein